jgi:hypothetical protein
VKRISQIKTQEHKSIRAQEHKSIRAQEHKSIRAQEHKSERGKKLDIPDYDVRGQGREMTAEYRIRNNEGKKAWGKKIKYFWKKVLKWSPERV